MKQHTQLEQALKPFFHWDARRINFLARFILALIQRSTVNLAPIACVLNTCVHPSSNEKRCQRFIKDFEVNLEDIARFILEGLPTRFELLLDRTEHFFGKTSVNVLTFAACVGSVRIPIIWDDLGKTGNSNTKERKDLLKALLRVMSLARIRVLIADREFIGGKWLAWLKNKRVPFVTGTHVSAGTPHQG